MMSAIEILHPGDPNVLRMAQRPIPQPGTGEVLLKVMAAGVNRPDIMQRKGLYPPPPGTTDIPGLEVSGTIIKTGKGVSRWQPGQTVCALLPGGGYAEYCLAQEALCLPLPSILDSVEAAALPETFCTVWANLFQNGLLREHDKFLVHGGAGGIGTTAIQLAAQLRNAQIFTTCGSDEKCRFCLELGANAAINYRREDFDEIIHRLTHQTGVDVILDIIGAPYLEGNLKSLATGGRLVIIAVQGGYRTQINLLPIFLKRLTLTGSTLRSRPLEEKALIARQLQKEVWPLLKAGTVRPIIHTTLPLAKAAEAHKIMENHEHIGKIVLIP